MPVHPTLPNATAFLLIYNLSQGNPRKKVTVHEYELQLCFNYSEEVKIGCLMYFSQTEYIQCSTDKKSFKITAKGIKAWIDFVNRPPKDYEKDFT